jgi:ribonuclease E
MTKPKSRRRKKTEAVAEPAPPEAPPAEAAEEPAGKPVRKRRATANADNAGADEPTGEAAEAVGVPAANNDTAPDDESEPRRSGWWQRTFG